MKSEELQKLLLSIFNNDKNLLQIVWEYLSDDVELPSDHLSEKFWNYLKYKILSANDMQPTCELLYILKRRVEELSYVHDNNNEYSYNIDRIFIHSLNDLKIKILTLKKYLKSMQNEWLRFGNEKVNIKQFHQMNFELDKMKNSFYVVLSYCSIDNLCENKGSPLLDTLYSIYKCNILNVSQFYLSMVSISPELLFQFCLREAEHCTVEVRNYPKKLTNEPFYTEVNLRYLLNQSVIKGLCGPFLFFSVIAKAFDLWDWPEKVHRYFAWYYPFHLLLFIHWWTSREEKLFLRPIFEEFLKHYIKSEPLIYPENVQNETNEAVEACVNSRPVINVSFLVSLLQEHSVNIMLSSEINLEMPYNCFLEILESLSLVKNESHSVSEDMVASNCTCYSTEDMILEESGATCLVEDVAVENGIENMKLENSDKRAVSKDMELDDKAFHAIRMMPKDSGNETNMTVDDLDKYDTSENFITNELTDEFKWVLKSTFQGYTTLLFIHQIIVIGTEMDQIISDWRRKHNYSTKDLDACNSYYENNVAKFWLPAKRILDEIPPDFRIEVMEILFSMLYTECTNYSDNSKLDFWIENETSSLNSSGISLDLSKPVISSSPIQALHEFSPFEGNQFQDMNISTTEINAMKIESDEKIVNNEIQEEKDISFQSRITDYDLNSIEPSLPLILMIGTINEIDSFSNEKYSSCNINTLIAWDLIMLLKDSLSEVGNFQNQSSFNTRFSSNSNTGEEDLQKFNKQHDLLLRVQEILQSAIVLPLTTKLTRILDLDIAQLCLKLIILDVALKSCDIKNQFVSKIFDFALSCVSSTSLSSNENTDLIGQFYKLMSLRDETTSDQNENIFKAKDAPENGRCINTDKDKEHDANSRSINTTFTVDHSAILENNSVATFVMGAERINFIKYLLPKTNNLLLPQTSNLSSLLTTICPSNIEDFMIFTNYFENLISSDDIAEIDFESLLKDKIIMLIDVINPCKKYFDLKDNEECQYQYLSILSFYVKMLVSVGCKYLKSFPKIDEFFHQLKERPFDMFARFSINMNIGTLLTNEYHKGNHKLSAIVDYLNSPFEDIGKDIDSTEDIPRLSRLHEELDVAALARFGCSSADGYYVMNANKIDCETLPYGVNVVEELLSLLLDHLHDVSTEFGERFEISHKILPLYLENSEIRQLLLKCSQLAHVDITDRGGNLELLVFYINFANMMYLHAALLNCLIFKDTSGYVGLFAKSKMEQLIAFKQVGYCVGKLGFVSLYDVLYKILEQPLVFNKQYMSNNSVLSLINTNPIVQRFDNILEGDCQFHPFLIFVVGQGMSPSPKIRAFNCNTYFDDLKLAVFEYIENVIHAPVKVENPILFTYLMSHPMGWDKAAESLRNITESTKDKLWRNSFMELLKNMNENLPNLEINFSLSIIITDYLDGYNVMDKNLAGIDFKEQPPDTLYLFKTCYSYIKNCCPILMKIIKDIKIIIKENKSTEKLKENNENEYSSSEIRYNNLKSISHCKIYCPRFKTRSKTINSSPKDVFASDFPFEQFYSIFIDAIEKIISDIPKEDFEKRNKSSITSILKVVDLLNELPTFVVEVHYVLAFIWDYVMAYLSSCDFSEADIDLWSFSYKIKNANLRFQVMKTYFINWPLEISLECLHFLLNEKSLDESQINFVELKIKQLEIYSEIINIHSENVSFKTWNDVMTSSLNNPDDVLTLLLRESRIILTVKWIESHAYTERFKDLYIKLSLYNIFSMKEPDLQKAEILLIGVEDKLECILKELLSSIGENKSRKFIISYFFKKIKSPNSDLTLLKQELIGLILIYDVSLSLVDKAQLISLIKKPNLIIEQWIMNLNMDYIKKGMQLISPILDSVDCIDIDKNFISGVELAQPSVDCLCWKHYQALIELYAAKALDISGSRSAKIVIEEKEVPFVMPAQIPKHSDWQENSTASICPVCNKSVFSVVCRRHHCRRCGRVVCGDCSLKRLIVLGYGDVPVRVCQMCFEILSDSSSSRSSNELEDISDNISVASLETGWHMTTESFHNKCLRDEFYYEYAPTVNVCHALFSLHKDDNRVAICILKLCHKTLQAVVESLSESSDLDQSFLLKIIQTLVSSAKVRFAKLLNFEGINLCEYFAQWGNRLQLIIDAQCSSLLSSDILSNMLQIGELQIMRMSGQDKFEYQNVNRKLDQERKYLRILRDKLVKNELWDLAFDISTKEGFENSGIWGASAIASLKGGDFKTAREIFAKILRKPKDKNVDTRIMLLVDIISILEKREFGICSDEAEINKSMQSVGIENSDDLDSHKIAESLQNTNTKNTESPQNTNAIDADVKPKLSSLNEKECEYYLELYGSHRSYLQFFIRHDRFKDSLVYSRENKIDERTFSEEVIVPIFKKGKLGIFWEDLLEVDPNESWSSSIMFRSCKYLDKMNQLHCILEIQKLLSDRVRAFWTLIKLYAQGANSYTELTKRNSHLSEAVLQLKEYLAKPVANPTPGKSPPQLSRIQIFSQTSNINFLLELADCQRKVTEYLASLENSGQIFQPKIKIIREILIKHAKTKSYYKMKSLAEVPNVFEPDNRLALMVLILCIEENTSENLLLVQQLIKSGSVDPKELLSVTVQTIMRASDTQYLCPVIEGVLKWGLIPDNEIKNILWLALSAGKNPLPEQIVKEITKFISNWRDRMDIFIEAGLLKLAYSQITDGDALKEVERLLNIATTKQDKIVVSYCTKWLQNYKKKRRSICKVTHKVYLLKK